MRGLNSLPLDDDVIDRILIFLPDYRTLRATILSSKAFYGVFQNHPHSILRAVSYNVTGPALPQALRVIRYSAPEPDAPTDPSMTPSPRPWRESDPVSPIRDEECRQLQQNAAVVCALEDLFSSRHKDRTSQVSVLNSMESWRFHRAVYRAMLITKAFPIEGYPEELLDDEPDPDALQKERLKRKQLLMEFSSHELRELRSVTLFLMEVTTWAAVAGCSDYPLLESEDVVLALGPARILTAYRGRTLDPMADELTAVLADDVVPAILEGYISEPLNAIWEGRKEKPPPGDAEHWKSILDSISGEGYSCQRCNNVLGFDLWNETNWEYLRGVSNHLVPELLPMLAKGNLHRNRLVVQALSAEFRDLDFTYTKFLDEIHQIRTPEYSSWNKEDWLCAPCVTDIIRTHLHLWLLGRKREAGEQNSEDCWYGYNCNTQVHKVSHATRLNHLYTGSGYFTQPLREIWVERQTAPPPDHATHWSSILESVQRKHDTCQSCQLVEGLNLWNETSESYLLSPGLPYQTTLGLESLAGYSIILAPKLVLPRQATGHLSQSLVDGLALTQRLNDQLDQGWMCATCVRDIVQQHLHLWLLERKRESGQQILPEDCWYVGRSIQLAGTSNIRMGTDLTAGRNDVVCIMRPASTICARADALGKR
ncbi:hypothetical protein LshimejAT787_0504010 [Lyophyllum shimeji]|uniref:F-box domain-containing protein n=1 Tax=Lyophyllum shimeji TaxID=47721 RepID=A0A9P3PNH9_LYOSH|nr:hypothetical protein LshimejAT787_0504010 [Lyophyllum shimeji]